MRGEEGTGGGGFIETYGECQPRVERGKRATISACALCVRAYTYSTVVGERGGAVNICRWAVQSRGETAY